MMDRLIGIFAIVVTIGIISVFISGCKSDTGTVSAVPTPPANNSGIGGTPGASPDPIVEQPDPEEAFRLNGVSQVAAGGDFTCALQDTGMVRCFGSNGDGRLGWGGSTGGANKAWATTVVQKRKILDEGEDLTDIVAITTGRAHACALTNTGGVYCWGDNKYGQLGNNKTKDSSMAEVVLSSPGVALTGVTSISAGHWHTCAVTGASNQAVCWGRNNAGQLGNPAVAQYTAMPIVVKGVSVQPLLTNVKNVSAGRLHSCATLNDARVVCWGENGTGQLGTNDYADKSTPSFSKFIDGPLNTVYDLDDVFSISGYSTHMCVAYGAEKQVRCWGANSSYQLGNVLVEAQSKMPWAIPVWNSGESEILSNVEQVTAGGNHACARLSNGVAMCWGSNQKSQIGDGEDSYTKTSSPQYVRGNTGGATVGSIYDISAGFEHTCIVHRGDRRVSCWGNNTSRQSGLDMDATAENIRPVPSAVYITNNGG